jgi:N-acetylmuramoyl-L-alanine amidase
MSLRHIGAALALLVLAGCATTPAGPPPVRSPLASWKPSPNFNARHAQMIVIHHTSIVGKAEALRVLSARSADPVGVQYLIGNDGSIDQLVDDGNRAWHAGAGRWGTITDVNSASIGIELDNDGYAPFTEPQIQSLLRLLQDLTTRLGIPRDAIVGHGDIAPVRKNDPNVLFPWERLARAGFGLWYDTPLIPPPPGFDSIVAMRLVGYDVSNPRAAVVAFHRHFRHIESDALDTTDAAILYSLQRKLTATVPARITGGP